MVIYRFFLFAILIMQLCSAAAYAATYSTDNDLIGKVRYYTVEEDDNLYEIARRFDLGIVEILAANPGIDPWMPVPGTNLTLTTQHILPPVREGIVLNLSELRLFYFMENGKVMTFPVGIGREGWQTPLGETSIVQMRKNPTWVPPDSIREENPDLPDTVPPGPDNPLGEYALNLGIPGIRIHGTNRPYGIGKRSSHGCVRMYPEDIKLLFNAVNIGTKVTILDMPYRVGWKADALYLEVMPTQAQSDAIAAYRQPAPIRIPEVNAMIRDAAGNTPINWDAVGEAISCRSGIPVIIGEKAPNELICSNPRRKSYWLSD